MEQRTMAARFVYEASDSRSRRGISAGPIPAACGLPAEVREPVSAEQYGVLWLAIEGEFFGLGGRTMRPGSFTLLCHCVPRIATLEQALRCARRLLRVAPDDPRGIPMVADGTAQIVLTDAGPPRSAFASADQLPGVNDPRPAEPVMS